MRTATIRVQGIVQGVGFRPFVYRTAKDLSLRGYVMNLGDAGVRIVAQGRVEDIHALVQSIQTRPPSIARVDEVSVEWHDIEDLYQDFTIAESSPSRESAATAIPPDISVCDECVREIGDPNSRYHAYPFTSCTACGPRYSTITALPYDRPNTTMDVFELCSACANEYNDPRNRRHHAQTTACQQCGPMYWLTDSTGVRLEERNPIAVAAKLIDNGSILAVQGIGGTHIVTLTTRPEPILELRRRKGRAQRPFAIMARNEQVARSIATLTSDEMELLRSWRRPIVLAKVRKDIVSLHTDEPSANNILPRETIEAISPGLDTIGIMLPYSPLHHLLFGSSKEPSLVMTSANPSGVPMYIEPKEILQHLKGIVDYFLLHNRKIAQRVDDSVVKFTADRVPVFLRRSRGYVPESLDIKGMDADLQGMALGPEEKATGSIVKAGRIYMTQHIGDTRTNECVSFLRAALAHLSGLLGCEKLDFVACDLHPDFLSTELAEQIASTSEARLIRVQHHHAHLASIMVDNNITGDTSIVCITADGFGLGSDGKAWGGEVIEGNMLDFKRRGGLAPFRIVGADLTATYPLRSAIAILEHEDDKEILRRAQGRPIAPNTELDSETLRLLRQAASRGINTIESTSAGRFLDAVSGLLGVCLENTYDGEAPMKLEAIARESTLEIEPVWSTLDGVPVLDIEDGLRQVMNAVDRGWPIPDVAYAAQYYIGRGLAEIALNCCTDAGIEYAGLSGGVALNRIVTRAFLEHLKGNGIRPLLHKRIPPGDGGISAGQAAVGAARQSL
ncbi:MAG: carbamoyltransferase HypF [Candidatus Thorarchaeota archaeon]